MRNATLGATIALALSSISTSAFGQASFEVLDAKVTSNVENKEAVDDKKAFNTGDKAFIWLKVKPAGEGAELRIRYSIDDKEVWTMPAVPVRLGRLWYYKTLRGPGKWKAEILDAADGVIKALEFTVTGEPVVAAAAGTPSDSVVAESAHFAVLELKLATEVKDKQPVAPSETFAAGDKVYAWLKLSVKSPETPVTLKWYAGDKPAYSSTPITVKQSPGWRTWTYKTASTAGAWKVEVLDADNTVVHTQSFTVQ